MKMNDGTAFLHFKTSSKGFGVAVSELGVELMRNAAFFWALKSRVLLRREEQEEQEACRPSLDGRWSRERSPAASAVDQQPDRHRRAFREKAENTRTSGFYPPPRLEQQLCLIMSNIPLN